MSLGRISAKCLIVIGLFVCVNCSSKEPATSSINTISAKTEAGDSRYDSGQKIRMRAFVRDLSSLYRIRNLQNVATNATDFEVRLWSSGESDYAKCIMINRDGNGVWSAQLVSPKFENGLVVKTDGDHIATEIVSQLKPKSGWNWLEGYFKKMDVSVPLRYGVDTSDAPSIPDEGAIGLEIKQNEKYDVIFYRSLTENSDGKLVIEVCKEMENQFNVSIGCTG